MGDNSVQCARCRKEIPFVEADINGKAYCHPFMRLGETCYMRELRERVGLSGR